MKAKLMFVGMFLLIVVGSAVAYNIKDLTDLKEDILQMYDGEKAEKDGEGKQSDPWVAQQMEAMRTMKDEDIKVPKGWNNMMVKYENVTVLTARLYASETTTTTLPAWKGCCYENACLLDEEKCKDLGFDLDCNEDKECATYKGCCIEKTCVFDEEKCKEYKFNCNEDKECGG